MGIILITSYSPCWRVRNSHPKVTGVKHHHPAWNKCNPPLFTGNIYSHPGVSIYYPSPGGEDPCRPNGVNGKKETYFGPIRRKPRNYTLNLLVTYAIFTSLNVNKKHVITPDVNSQVATKSV